MSTTVEFTSEENRKKILKPSGGESGESTTTVKKHVSIETPTKKGSKSDIKVTNSGTFELNDLPHGFEHAGVGDRKSEGGFITGQLRSKVAPLNDQPKRLNRSLSIDLNTPTCDQNTINTINSQVGLQPTTLINLKPAGPGKVSPKEMAKTAQTAPTNAQNSTNPKPANTNTNINTNGAGQKVNGSLGSSPGTGTGTGTGGGGGKKESTIIRSELISSVEINNLERVRKILRNGIDPNSVCDEKGRFPLHIASLHGYSSMVRLLLDHRATLDQMDTTLERTPLHYACTNSPEIVQILLSYGCEINARNKFGSNALHLAAGAGQGTICRILANSGCSVNAVDRNKCTPLMCASRVNDIESIETLLEFGAKMDVVDDKGRGVLYYAAEPWEGMNIDSGKMGATFRRLIAAGANVNKLDNDGKSALFYAIQTGSSEAVITLYDLGAELLDGVSLLGMARKFPQLIQQFLDKCVTSNLATCDPESKNFYIQFDYTCLTLVPKDVPENKLKALQNREETEGCLPELGVLHGLTRCKDTSILSHPLCESLLRLKWKKVKWYLYLDMLLFAVFLAFLTAVIFMEYESEDDDLLLQTTEDINSTLTTTEMPLNLNNGGLRPFNRSTMTTTPTSSILHGQHHRRIEYCLDGTRNIVVWVILWFLTACLGIREMIQLVQSPLHYIVQIENMLELTLVFAVALLSLAECGVSNFIDARDHFAAFCLIVGWTVQVTLYGKIPYFGPYIRMFAAVAQNILKCLFTYLGLLFAFSLTLHFLFRSHSEFDSVGFTFLKTFAMMIGEIDLIRSFIDKKPGDHIVPFTSHLMFALFIIFISVILMSLLIAIAVNDILLIQKEGDYLSLVQQINVSSQLEDALQHRSLLYPQFGMRDPRSLHQRKGVIFPNIKDHGKLSKIALEIVMEQHTKKVDSSSLHEQDILHPTSNKMRTKPRSEEPSTDRGGDGEFDLTNYRAERNALMKANTELTEGMMGKMQSKIELLTMENEERTENLLRELRIAQEKSISHLTTDLLLLKDQLDSMNICLQEICSNVKRTVARTISDETGSSSSTSQSPDDHISTHMNMAGMEKRPDAAKGGRIETELETDDDIDIPDVTPRSPARTPPLAPPPPPLDKPKRQKTPTNQNLLKVPKDESREKDAVSAKKRK